MRVNNPGFRAGMNHRAHVILNSQTLYETQRIKDYIGLTAGALGPQQKVANKLINLHGFATFGWEPAACRQFFVGEPDSLWLEK